MNESSKPTRSKNDGLEGFFHGLKLVVFFGLTGFLAFVAGGVSTVMKAPVVDDFMQSVSMGLFYLYESNFNPTTFDYFWYPSHLPGPEDGNPVMLNDKALSSAGYNLVVGTNEQAATLIDMDGNVVHKWARRFDEIWDVAPQLAAYKDHDKSYWADKIYWRRTHLFPNGDILVVFETPYHTPYGIGLAKLDKDSNVIWKLDANPHHDIAVDPTGRIYTLGSRINETGYAGYPSLKPPFIDDSVMVVTADGKVEKEIFLLPAFLNSQYSAFLSFMDLNLRGDIMHANAVQYIDAELAAKFPFADEGDLLISVREMNVIAVLDPKEERIIWAQTGPWRGQHEPVMLDDGNIVLFDNQGNSGDGGQSRVIEFDPIRDSIQWSYSGTAKEPLYSPYWGAVQRLENGNTLILESTNGRVFEVTEDGRVVWDYRSPYRKTAGDGELVMPLLDAVRFRKDDLKFLN